MGVDVRLHRAPSATPEYHHRLLETLGSLGLPKDGELRYVGLGRIRQGLASELPPVFSAAAHAVMALQPLAAAEAQPLLPLIARRLSPTLSFKSTPERVKNPTSSSFSADERLGQISALRALCSLGKSAREILPAVKAIADQPLVDRRGSFLPEPPLNAVIREARKTLQAIE